MAALEVGTVCMKVAGREAGRYCVVVKRIDENFVMVTGPKALTNVRRRRCNVEHLEATPYKLEVKEDAPDTQVLKAYEKAGLIPKLGLKKPPAVALKPPKKPKVKKPKKKFKKPKAKKKVKKKS
jgi:large subunit ribosomal protein L14e